MITILIIHFKGSHKLDLISYRQHVKVVCALYNFAFY